MEKLIRKLNDYFDCPVIGSYLFVREGYLNLDQINDIDIMVKGQDKLLKVIKFLEDEEFKENPLKNGMSTTTGIDKYANFREGTLMFESPKYELPIHLLLTNVRQKVQPLSEVLGTKWKNSTVSDLEQLKSILERTEHKTNK